MEAMGRHGECCSGQRDFRQRDEIRFVIVGKTGAGKSATANTLIGKRVCTSRLLGSSETSIVEKVEGSRDGRKLLIVDTPGLFDTRKSNVDVSKEIMKCIGISSPGPHIVVLVIQIGRISQEEQETVDRIIEYFGDPVYEFMVVVFTKMDDVIQAGATIENFISSLPDKLKQVLWRCENRCIGFNNMAQGEVNEKQLKQFFTLSGKTIEKNGGSCYTNQIYREVEAALQKRIITRQNELEANKKLEIKSKLHEIQQKYQKRGLTEDWAMTENINMQEHLGNEDLNNQPFKLMDVKGMQTEKQEHESEQDFIERRNRLVQEAMHVQHQKEIAQLKQKMEEDKRNVMTEIIKIYEGKMKAEHLRETERDAIVKDNPDALGLLQRIWSYIKRSMSKK